ncbi:MAG TPA: hypothetical protein VFA88_04485 [Gaiellaceae bacterium]|nr:hypothetical protein [Gaiellaceae bacterium]
MIDDLLRRLEAGELGDPLPALAYLAGQAVTVGEPELNEARRRSLLLLAAGGDPSRGLGVDDRAVKALAVELYTEERRVALGRELDALVLRVRELPRLRDAAVFLAGEPELAWRLYALALLADELGADA